MYGYIYKTTDKFTNKIYVGKKHSDKFLGSKYVGNGLIITNIKNKLLESNMNVEDRLTVELIDIAESLQELNAKEMYWIDTLDAMNPDIGYNMRKGGDCGPGGPMFQGHNHSIETRQRMSANRRGYDNANYGNRWSQSDELKQLHSKLSAGENNGMYGKHHSIQSKQKNRLSHKGKIAVSNVIQDKVIMIYETDLDDYLSHGWIKGNIHTHRIEK